MWLDAPNRTLPVARGIPPTTVIRPSTASTSSRVFARDLVYTRFVLTSGIRDANSRHPSSSSSATIILPSIPNPSSSIIIPRLPTSLFIHGISRSKILPPVR